jgi:hypothetical protein
MSQTTSMTPMTTFDASVELNQSVEKQMAAAMAASTTRMVEFLASEYGFNAAEAIQRLGLDSVSVTRPMKKKAAPKAPKAPKEKRMVPSVPLPFCGMVKEDWCCGLRLNHGLYSQCTMLKGNDTDFCKTCIKQVEKNESNKPTYGVIQDRMAVEPMDFRDPKGKAVVCYGNVMAKLKITKETAIAEAAKFGLVIGDEQFEERKTTRGRPKKDASASDSDSDGSEKKRGRPKKSKKVVATEVGDDFIGSLVAVAQLNGLGGDGSESDVSVKSVVSDKSDISVSSVKSAVSTNSTGSQKKVKAPKPELTDEEKAVKKAATAAKRAATKAANLAAMTDEEKAAKKAAASAKRAATVAAKKKAVEDDKPAAILGVTVPADPVVVAAPVVTVTEVVVPEVIELVEEAVSDDESDGDDIEDCVEKFEHAGVSYLKSQSDGWLFNPETKDPVGVWNAELKQVDDIPADEE